MIVAADWLPYALPLRRPWRTSRTTLTTRHGRLLRLRSANGRLGWGDAAPWAEFGIDDDQASAFAEEVAQLDLAAQAAGLPLGAWLSGQPAVRRLAVNAVAGPLCANSAVELRHAGGQGYSVVKFKVGVAPLADEIACLRQLAEQLPAGITLRLDANRAWSYTDAKAFVCACPGLPIECLEEPLATPDHASLATLQAIAGFPLAVDESVDLLNHDFFMQPPVGRVVIKPARQGGLLACVELALRARQAGVDVVVTSSLESACGLLACAHLAAAVAPQGIHGLATGDWLRTDTGHPPPIVAGQFHLPNRPGLGFEPVEPYSRFSAAT